MGIPLKNEESSSASISASSPVNHSSYHANASANGNSNSSNGVDSSHSSSGAPSHIFLYGDSRPDAPSNTQNLPGLQNKRAWLLGSRLYSFSTGGVRRAAVKLEESGHAVLGYAVSTNDSMGITRLLDEFERREYLPDLYERDIVEWQPAHSTNRQKRYRSAQLTDTKQSQNHMQSWTNSIFH